MLLKSSDVLIGHFVGEPRQNLPLHTGPGLKDVLGLRKARLRNSSAPIGRQINQSLRIKACQGGSDYGSAYPEALTDQVFCQLVTW
jgi:hypothetical protein